MISIKCKIKNEIQIDDYLRQFNNVVRFAYNRFCDSMEFTNVYHKCNKDLNNIGLLDCSFVESAVLKGQWVFKTRGIGVIFGGKKDFEKLKYKKRESYFLENRNKWLYSQGRASFKGNRKFNFDLSNNKLEFKPKYGVKIEIEFEKVGKNQKKILDSIQLLSQSKRSPIGVLLSKDYVVFQVDEKIIQEQKKTKTKKNRVLSIDSNPEFIGVTICDFKDENNKKIIYKEVLDLRKLKNASTKKRHYEIFESARHIAKLAKHYGCELVGYEDLNIGVKNHKKGKEFNKKINNKWNRVKFFGNLNKWLNIYDIKYQAILPQYSSFIGQLIHESEPDMIAAALEIGRRAYIFNRVYLVKDLPKEKFSGVVYPELATVPLSTRWKEMIESKGCKTWKSLFSSVKKSKLSYRFLFYDWVKDPKVKVFRLKSRRSNIFLCLR